MFTLNIKLYSVEGCNICGLREWSDVRHCRWMVYGKWFQMMTRLPINKKQKGHLNLSIPCAEAGTELNMTVRIGIIHKIPMYAFVLSLRVLMLCVCVCVFFFLKLLAFVLVRLYHLSTGFASSYGLTHHFYTTKKKKKKKKEKRELYCLIYW